MADRYTVVERAVTRVVYDLFDTWKGERREEEYGTREQADRAARSSNAWVDVVKAKQRQKECPQPCQHRTEHIVDLGSSSDGGTTTRAAPSAAKTGGRSTTVEG